MAGKILQLRISNKWYRTGIFECLARSALIALHSAFFVFVPGKVLVKMSLAITAVGLAVRRKAGERRHLRHDGKANYSGVTRLELLSWRLAVHGAVFFGRRRDVDRRNPPQRQDQRRAGKLHRPPNGRSAASRRQDDQFFGAGRAACVQPAAGVLLPWQCRATFHAIALLLDYPNQKVLTPATHRMKRSAGVSGFISRLIG